MTTTKAQSVELIRAVLHAAKHGGLNTLAHVSHVESMRQICGGTGKTPEGLPEIDDKQLSNLDVIHQLLHAI